MKRVVSVSLGSSRRDHRGELVLLGEKVEVQRVGTDGDMERARRWIRELDAREDVHAIGLGGIDMYLFVRGRRFEVRDGVRLAAEARRLPVVDGSGIKDVWEREVVARLLADGRLRPGQRVLMVSALDRFGMAEALVSGGLQPVFGDLMFGAGIPYAVTDLDELAELSGKILTEMVKLPFHMLYPTGPQQEQAANAGKFASYYLDADVVAGDFHYIRKHLPERLTGQGILTNTTTEEDLALLRERGAGWVVTTTPRVGGRSFGTNVVEAALVAVAGGGREGLRREELAQLLRAANLEPGVVDWSAPPPAGGIG